MKTFKFLILGILLSFFIGCIESEQTFYINPDGSGKVLVRSSFQTMNFITDNSDKKKQSVEKLKKEIKKILENSKGIEAWKNVSYKYTDEGKIKFKGIAYFKDINKLAIKDASLLRLTFKKNKKRNIIITIKGEKKKKKNIQEKVKKRLSEKEIKAEILKEKASYKKMQPMMTMIFSTMKLQYLINLPGKVLKTVNLTKKSPNKVYLNFSGDKLLQVINKLVEDDKWWRKQVTGGKNFKKDNPFDDKEVNRMLYGEKGPIQVIVSKKTKSLFNYKKEVKQAKKEYIKILKSLEIEDFASPIVYAKGSSFKSLKIGGIKIIEISDSDNNILPFYQNKGIVLSLIGEFPGAVLKIKEGKVIKALTDTGENLLAADSWKQSIYKFNLSTDKKFVVFETELKLPKNKVRYIKQLSGYLIYESAAGIKKVDLGFSKIAPGEIGKNLNAKIISIKKDKWQKGAYIMELEITSSESAVRDIRVYDKDGLKLTAKKTSVYEYPKGTTKIKLFYEKKFPEAGKIILNKFDKIEEYKVPFNLKNISLTVK